MPLITVATKADPGFQLFAASCELKKIKPIVLGMNDPRPMNHKVDGMGLKLILIDEFVSKNSAAFADDEVFILSDSFDVIVADAWEVLVSKFKQFNADIVVSVEKNCHPDPSLAPRFDALAPQKPWRYINTGGLALTFGTLKKLLKFKPFEAKSDDQLWFQEVFFDPKSPFKIVLDYDCQLFQTVYLSFNEVACDLEGRWLNRITGSQPSLIHGNAMPFNMMLHIFRMTFPLVQVNGA